MTIPMKNGMAALAVRIKSEINIIVLNLIIRFRIFLFRRARIKCKPKDSSRGGSFA